MMWTPARLAGTLWGMNDLQDKLAASRAAYVDKLQRRLDELQELLQQARTAPERALEPLQQAQRLAHKICGSAGTFGFAAAGEAAGEIDRLLLGAGELDDAGTDAGTGVGPPIDELWQQIDAALQRARDSLK